MQSLISIIFLFIGIIFLLAFINLKLAIALYISYNILVPFLQFDIFGISLSYNVINLFLIISFLITWKNKKIDYKPLIPFIFIFISISLISIFQWEIPFELQINYLRIDFMKTCFVPFIIWNISKYDIKIIIYIKWALLISMIIACIYGLFLMNLNGLNPYTSYLSSYFHQQDYAYTYLMNAGDSRISFSSSRSIQSTMSHPMRWALYICFLVIIVIVFLINEKNKLLFLFFILFIFLLLFNLLISGVRTGLVTLLIAGTFYLIKNKNMKILLFSGILIFFISIIITSNKDFINISNSFTNSNGTKSDISGSSISLRLEQLEGCFTEIKNNYLLGKGYGWTNYYQSKNGDHPVILAFESIIFVILCNNGIIGLFIWAYFFYLLARLNRKLFFDKISILILDVIIIVYFSFSIGTGEYDYLPIFSTLYIFLICYLGFNIKIISKNTK